MRRARSFGLALALFAAAIAAEAQAPGKMHRIGYLASGSASALARSLDALRQGLRGFGWIEGQNLLVEYRFAEGKFERLPALASELVSLKIEVLIANATPSAIAASNATRTVPIVIVAVGDPLAQGLVASLARPGGNLTGLAISAGFETNGKWIELLKEAVPTMHRSSVLVNPANPSHPPATKQLELAARSLGVELQVLEARDPEGIDNAFATMAKDRAGGLVVVTDPLFIFQRARLAELAVKNGMPTVHGVRENVEAGGLLSYGPSLPDLHLRAAAFVDKILKGAKPADLPVEQPTKFELVINLKTAKALGLIIPPSLVLRADRVIE